MRGALQLIRFFRVVPPVPSLMVGAFAVIVALAAIVLTMDPGRGAAAVTPILVLQLFAAASGIAVPARRGHYDLLLTRGDGRLVIAVAHWVMSIWPGAASWLAVGALEQVSSRGTDSAVLASGTFAAMLLVSTLPWAISTTLPRFAASVGWLLVLVSAATLAPAEHVASWLWTVENGRPAMASAAGFLLYPLTAVGRHLNAGEAARVLPALVLAACAMIAACLWMVRADFPLEAAQ